MSDHKPMEGLLMCVCQGTCPSFQQMNVFEVMNALRREKLVDWVALHPQLCADDGDAYLRQLLKGALDLDRLYVAGCDPTMQRKMFRFVFDEMGFDPQKHRAVDIRNMTTEQAVEAIKQLIAQED